GQYTGRRRRGRVVEGTPLLRVQTGNRLEGSNPFVSAIIPVANTDRRPSRRGNIRVFKGLCLPHANLRGCAPGLFRALNGSPSLSGRTSPNSVRSDFSSSFQQPEFQ